MAQQYSNQMAIRTVSSATVPIPRQNIQSFTTTQPVLPNQNPHGYSTARITCGNICDSSIKAATSTTP
jgi:hypothetical protein